MLHQTIALIIAQITECKTYKDMIDIQELKNEITDTIKSNGRGEITAEKEQRILLKVADAIDERVTTTELADAIAQAITQTLNTAV